MHISIVKLGKIIMLFSSSLQKTGTQINYYFVCHRKLWLFSHGLCMEHTSDTVHMGKLISKECYNRENNKEIEIDGFIKVDFMDSKGIIHEVKKSNKIEKAHLYQLAYYLYNLKLRGLTNIEGELNYPKLKKRERVYLTEKIEKNIYVILQEIESILLKKKPPQRRNLSFCKKCSYYELCWI